LATFDVAQLRRARPVAPILLRTHPEFFTDFVDFWRI
jgi:hypothetical protein